MGCVHREKIDVPSLTVSVLLLVCLFWKLLVEEYHLEATGRKQLRNSPENVKINK